MGMPRTGVIEDFKARSRGYWPEVRGCCIDPERKHMELLQRRRESLAASMEAGAQMLNQCANRLMDLAHVQDLEKHSDGSWQVKGHLGWAQRDSWGEA